MPLSDYRYFWDIHADALVDVPIIDSEASWEARNPDDYTEVYLHSADAVVFEPEDFPAVQYTGGLDRVPMEADCYTQPSKLPKDDEWGGYYVVEGSEYGAFLFDARNAAEVDNLKFAKKYLAALFAARKRKHEIEARQPDRATVQALAEDANAIDPNPHGWYDVDSPLIKGLVAAGWTKKKEED